MKIALDTSGYSAYFTGNQSVRKYIQAAEEVVLPCTVLGELYAAFYRGTKLQQNLDGLEKFLTDSRVKCPVKNSETAKTYGALVAQLKSQGTPIPTNDVWIAAETILNLTKLVTLDTDFKNVIGLDVVILKPEPPL